MSFWLYNTVFTDQMMCNTFLGLLFWMFLFIDIMGVGIKKENACAAWLTHNKHSFQSPTTEPPNGKDPDLSNCRINMFNESNMEPRWHTKENK